MQAKLLARLHTSPCRLHTSGLTLAPDVDLAELAASCHGYSGADLAALAREAAMHALTGVAQQLLQQPWQQAPADGGWPPVNSLQAGSVDGPAQAMTAAAAWPGFEVGVDLCLEPGARAGQGAAARLGVGAVSTADFQAAMRRVGPSIVRGAEVEVAPIRCVV